MAGGSISRARLYAWVRKTHLFTGLVLLVFVVMYFVTGYPIIHNRWFDNPEPVMTERFEALAPIDADDVEDVAVQLQQQLGINGKRVKMTEEYFEYFRPGHFYQVWIQANGDSARVVTQEFGWKRTMVGFHRMHNYGGGALYDLWVVLYDLASLSLVVFVLTGIYLWWRLAKRRFWGWVCLGLSWGYTGATVAYLMYAR